MTRIVATTYRYKRPAKKQAKAVATKAQPPRATCFQPPPRDWDYPTVPDPHGVAVGRLIVLSDPRWNTAPLRADDERRIFVANHVACRKCGEPAGKPCFSMWRGARVVPERRLQVSHAERWLFYSAKEGVHASSPAFVNPGGPLPSERA